MRHPSSALTAFVFCALVACGPDDATSSDVDLDTTTDVAIDAPEDSADDIDATDVPPADADVDAAEDVELDTPEDTADADVEPEGNPPLAPVVCIGETQTISYVPGTGLTAELDVENTTTTGVRVSFLGRESDVSAEFTLACAVDIVPDGVVALTPAWTLSSDGPQRFDRRYFVNVPFFPGDVPIGAVQSALRIYRTLPDGTVHEPVLTNFQEDFLNGGIRFETQLTGTFQVGVRDDAGEPREREWTFRAISGVSMGALGSSMIGARHPDRFDIVAPLGGPAEWVYLAQYISGGGMGGFGDNEYEVTQEFEHGMSYEDWYFSTGEGTGGSFNRNEYSEIFLDLSLSVGNIITWNPDSPFLAPGITADEVLRGAAARCLRGNTCPPDSDTALTIESGFFDNEYNPDGAFPVIAFCDGRGDRDRDRPFDRACDVNFDGEPDEANEGLFLDPCVQSRPMDITLAVDTNGNGMRDVGEPVIRNSWEDYEDLGTDGLASSAEEGFDALSNPDPAGDDYDYVDNPFGTEGNWLWDEGEPYNDFGIDGVEGSPSWEDGGFDIGEGNGRFDYNPNLQRVYDEMSPRHLIQDMSPEVFRDTNWFIDAGVRDLFNFVVGANQLAGTIQGMGGNVRVYDGFSEVQGIESGFNFTLVDYANLGQNVLLRYGDRDADEEDICFGDGKHVGTVAQIANRLLTMLGFITNRFPDPDRELVRAPFPLSSGTYFAPTGDSGERMRYSIAFPPGYEWSQCTDGRDNDRDGLKDGQDPDCISGESLSEGGEEVTRCTDGIDNDADGRRDEEDEDCINGDGLSEYPMDSRFRSARYPVIYLLHGYGQTPDDLQVTALPFSGFMASGIWPKAIIIFPDGFCGEVARHACNDQIDNDGDGLFDEEDDGCAASGNRSETGETPRWCEDGIDNDLDGLADLEDGGCLNAPDWDSENNCIQGNFYTNHVSYLDGAPGGPQYEDIFFDLMDHVDDVYQTRPPQTFPTVE
ncbi:MAG: hypothetical protein ACJAYU_002877 [Bradymonadia bacterium]|jgi:hypothetical protein